MSYGTLRFGVIDPDEAEIIQVPAGIAPFEWATRFVVLSRPEEEPFRWLQSLDDPALAFVIAPLDELFAADAVRLRSALPAPWRGACPGPLGMLGLIVLDPDPDRLTVNLLAPLVVDWGRRIAEQVVLEGPLEWARRPLRPAPAAA